MKITALLFDNCKPLRSCKEVTTPLLRKCPTCGGELVDKQVEEITKGGVNFAAVTAKARVCLRCGQRLYDPDTMRLLKRITKQLSAQEVEDFEPMGRSFRVPA